MILTDEEITEVMDRGDVVEGNRFLPFAYARAIEAKIEAKLREQEPVGYFCPEYMGGPVIYYQVQYSSKDEEGVIPLFEHPAPTPGLSNKLSGNSGQVPAGYQLVPVEPTEAMLKSLLYASDLQGGYKKMLAAARSEKWKT